MSEFSSEFQAYDPSKLPSEQYDATEFIYDAARCAEFVRLHRNTSNGHGSDATGNIITEVVRQLRPGMDVTRVSLPAVCTKPISTLESIAENCCPSSVLLFRYLQQPQPQSQQQHQQHQEEEDKIYRDYAECISKFEAAVDGTTKSAAELEGDVKHSMSLVQGLMQPLRGETAADVHIAQQQRMVAVLQWSLVLLANTPQKGFKHVKPFMAYKGEQFLCTWQHVDGSTTRCFSEEVTSAQGAPIGCLFWHNDKHNVSFETSLKVVSTFGLKASETSLRGHRVLRLHNLQEDYHIELLPPISAHVALLFGQHHVGYTGQLVISCPQSGLRAVVDFDAAKSKSNSDAIVGGVVSGGRKLWHVSGSITGHISIQPETGNNNNNSSLLAPSVLVDAKAMFHRMLPKMSTTVPLSQQQDLESRRTWHDLAFAIKTHDDERNVRRMRQLIEERQAAKQQLQSKSSAKPVLFREETQLSTPDKPVWTYLHRDEHIKNSK